MLGCWWFQWRSFGSWSLVPQKFRNGGVVVAVCGVWWLGLRQALVLRFAALSSDPARCALLAALLSSFKCSPSFLSIGS
ncbi:unnamed protein product [Eruca vesicaria subsp. sativa]|uniref:Secreted protein n=1 Tax=Eruca vesicaria subsp. sativa TaxID=29727 RepID=A0ABC8L0B7_ERUVS|nr:unnamed protein product [Eruca vesicaria subsp. sativa]